MTNEDKILWAVLQDRTLQLTGRYQDEEIPQTIEEAIDSECCAISTVGKIIRETTEGKATQMTPDQIERSLWKIINKNLNNRI